MYVDYKEDIKSDNSLTETFAESAVVIICIVLGAAFVIMSIIGHVLHNEKVNRCTGLTTATKYDDTIVTRLAADRSTGYVYTEYEYTSYFEYEIDGNTYYASISSAKPIEDVGIVDVYYNPDNYSEHYLDADIFNKDGIVLYIGEWDSHSAWKPALSFIKD